MLNSITKTNLSCWQKLIQISKTDSLKITDSRVSNLSSQTSKHGLFFNPRKSIQALNEYYPHKITETITSHRTQKDSSVKSSAREMSGGPVKKNSAQISANYFDEVTKLYKSQKSKMSQTQQKITQMKLKSILTNNLKVKGSRKVTVSKFDSITKNSLSKNNTINDSQGSFNKFFQQTLNSHLKSPVKSPLKTLVSNSLDKNLLVTTPLNKINKRPELQLNLLKTDRSNTGCLTERFAKSTSNKEQDPNQTLIQRLKSDILTKDSLKIVKSAREYAPSQTQPQQISSLKGISPSVFPCDPKTAVAKFGYLLNQQELVEINQYETIYFLGAYARKIEPNEQHAFNLGYDNDKGDFIYVDRDHIAYRYEMVDRLGKGSFGQAFKVFDHKRKQLAAMKIIKNKKRFHNQALIEIDILKCVRDACESVIKIRDYFVFRNHVCIVFELLSLNLYEFLKKNDFEGMNLDLIRRISIQLLQALFELKRKQIIHCDLKPENILLKEENKSGIKVIDFGSSCFADNKMYTYIQSRFYRAPEIVLGLPYDWNIDIWSFGCIMVELATGYPIFPSENELDHMILLLECLGVPPINMIKGSTKGSNYFNEEGQPITMTSTKGTTRVLKSRTIESVLSGFPPQFIDFVGCFLRWQHRYTPAQGLVHPWILDGLPTKIRKQHLEAMKKVAPYLKIFHETTNTSSEIYQDIMLSPTKQGTQGETSLMRKKF